MLTGWCESLFHTLIQVCCYNEKCKLTDIYPSCNNLQVQSRSATTSLLLPYLNWYIKSFTQAAGCYILCVYVLWRGEGKLGRGQPASVCVSVCVSTYIYFCRSGLKTTMLNGCKCKGYLLLVSLFHLLWHSAGCLGMMTNILSLISTKLLLKMEYIPRVNININLHIFNSPLYLAVPIVVHSSIQKVHGSLQILFLKMFLKLGMRMAMFVSTTWFYFPVLLNVTFQTLSKIHCKPKYHMVLCLLSFLSFPPPSLSLFPT